MKKFMKAIAFVTVMCMALSTVAFAHSVPQTANADKTFKVTVTDAGTDQVALMVVEAANGNYDFSNPLYIDQQGANAGTAEFTAKIAKDVTAVDVYVGYASNPTPDNKAAYLGKVDLVQPITEVTIAKVDTEIIQSVAGEQQIGAGVAITFDVEAPKNVSATNMIWAIRYTEDGVEKVKYTEAFDVTEYAIGTVLKSGVQLGLAFLNGFTREGEEIASVEITDVDVIFLFTDGEEAFTNDADKK